MTPHKRETFEPVTMGHIRSHGCRDLLVYCAPGWCNHSAVMGAARLPDDTPVRSSCPRMVCTACELNDDTLPDAPMRLHPRHRHDLDDFYPCARHLQMGMVLAEDLCGRIMRFGLHNRIAANLIFCI